MQYHIGERFMRDVIDNIGKASYHVTEVEKKQATEKLLTVQEICELLKVPKTYIYWLTHKRQIPFIKMMGHLRFRQSDIDAWLESKEVRIVS
jgi:excisionase family DNA binding protein